MGCSRADGAHPVFTHGGELQRLPTGTDGTSKDLSEVKIMVLWPWKYQTGNVPFIGHHQDKTS